MEYRVHHIAELIPQAMLTLTGQARTGMDLSVHPEAAPATSCTTSRKAHPAHTRRPGYRATEQRTAAGL